MEEASMRDEMTDVFEVIRPRRSGRRFADIDVPTLDLERILDDARYVPSSGNQQPWKLLVSRDRSRHDGLRKLALREIGGRMPYSSLRPCFLGSTAHPKSDSP
jgi:nitroreductase